MTQTTLFPEDPCAGKHHDNPESRAAFDRVLPHLGELQRKVLDYAAGRGSGLTLKSTMRDLDLQPQTVSPRLTELLQQELLMRTGQRRDGCAILEITDLGRRTLATLPAVTA